MLYVELLCIVFYISSYPTTCIWYIKYGYYQFDIAAILFKLQFDSWLKCSGQMDKRL